MTRPLTTGATVAPLPFADRLQLVSTEIEARINRTPTTNPFHLRARLWKNWLFRNVLDIEVVREVAL
jgi:hypothetical protein